MFTIFFDLDDTVIATQEANARIYETFRRALGIVTSHDAFERSLKTALRKHMLRLSDFEVNRSIGIDPIDYFFSDAPYPYGDVDALRRGVYEDMVSRYPGRFTEKVFTEALYACGDMYTETVMGMREVIDFLHMTGTVRVGLITNGISDVQRRKLKTARLEGCFDPLIVSGDAGIGKPDPRIYRRALACAGVDPQRAMMVGDNPEADIMGALAMGMQAIYFSAKPCRYAVEHVDSAGALLEKIKGIVFDPK